MTTLPPLKVARAYPPSVVVKEGNKEVLYVVGGWGNQLNQINGDQLLASVEKFVDN